MEIPEHWAKSESRFIRRSGREFPAFTWGWSRTSEADAARLAQERVQAFHATHEAPWQEYPYGARPLQEPILFEKLGAEGEQLLVLTVNSYGSRVLNSANVLFVDIDIPQPRNKSPLTSILRLFGRGKKTEPPENPETAHLAKLRQFLVTHPQWGFRVYRTAAGLRYLATHATHDPASTDVAEKLKMLGCDPMFVMLCQRHKSFRARLTPKPWRCGISRPAQTFPFETAESRQHFEQWQRQYEDTCAGYATCHYLETAGNHAIVPEVQEVVSIHDEQTKADTSLPLA